MREILFRGKAANRDPRRSYRTKYKNGDWVYGLLTYVKNYAGFSEMTNTNGVSGIEVDKNTVGQFTGLTDKNGKKIFEGDICRVIQDGDTKQGVVVQFNGAFGLLYKNGEFTSFLYLKRSRPEGCWFDTLEVIGNIHDQPELMEVSE